MSEYDAIVVGSGPNGLTAAARLAVAGQHVLVLERATRIGGGSRTEPLGEGGAVYDVCATSHPFGATSPAFRMLELDRYGLEWRHAPLPLAHPLDDGDAAVLDRDVSTTAAALGVDGDAYANLAAPILQHWAAISAGFLGPVIPIPSHPIAMARFGVNGTRSAASLVRRFREPRARALLGGFAAHACLPLTAPLTGGLALSLCIAGHAVGWPMAGGGSQSIADALAAVVTAHGGEIVTGHDVRSLASLPPTAATILDLTPRQILDVAGPALAGRRGWRLRRWRYGPGVCKADYLLAGPVPWTAEPCRQAAVVHLGGRFEDVAAAELATTKGIMPARPYALAAQPTLADPDRAPAGVHVLWTYCHVPHGTAEDVTDHIERQLERFAPGWRDLVLLKRARTAVELERYNPNDVGGDISGGSLGGLQLLLRPWGLLDPYRTPLPGVWQCSASTPPGPGVHGMGGWHAAGRVLRATRRDRSSRTAATAPG